MSKRAGSHTPWWNDEEDTVTNVIRWVDYIMQDDEGNFLSIISRACGHFELTTEELGQVVRHFTDAWLRDYPNEVS